MIEQRLMHFAIEAARDGIVIADAQAVEMPIVYANAAFSRMTGFGSEEVIGRNCRFLQAEDNEQAGIATLKGAMAGSRACLVTLRNYRKDGTLFWNELSISPVADTYGRVTHYIGVQKDVTVRVRAVEQLAAANARLDLINDNASQLAYRDPVTGAFSREYFEHSLKRSWALWQRHSLPVGCLMITVQLVRGGQGRPSTDGLEPELKRIANAASRLFCRGADMVARFSSTELIVIGADMDGSAARTMAEKLLAEIARLPMAADRPIPGAAVFTRAIGVASVTPNQLILATDLLNAAGNGLRDALAAGGNGVGFGLLAHRL